MIDGYAVAIHYHGFLPFVGFVQLHVANESTSDVR